MTAKEYILSNGGAWPDESVATLPPPRPEVQRLAEAYRDPPELLDAVAACRLCPHFEPAGWTCRQDPGRCGGCSVRALWASTRCPEGKW